MEKAVVELLTDIRILMRRIDSELKRREQQRIMDAVGKRFKEDEEMLCPPDSDYHRLDQYDNDRYRKK